MLEYIEKYRIKEYEQGFLQKFRKIKYVPDTAAYKQQQ